MIIVILLVFITVGIGAFYAFNTYIYDQKQHSEPPREYRATLEGKYVCLDQRSIDTCEKGLRTDVGETYAVNFWLMPQTLPTLNIGDRLRASGMVMPVELVSAQVWHDLGVAGIFSVTDSLAVLK